MNPNAPAWLLTGFVLLHLFNRFVTAFVCERKPDSTYGIGLIPMLGIGIHSLIDGFLFDHVQRQHFHRRAGRDRHGAA